jgi:hypothetical protein
MSIIIHYSSPFAIIFFIAKFATIILPSNANGLNILVIEPNFPRGMSHFALHKQMVEELAEKEWVKKVVSEKKQRIFLQDFTKFNGSIGPRDQRSVILKFMGPLLS